MCHQCGGIYKYALSSDLEPRARWQTGSIQASQVSYFTTPRYLKLLKNVFVLHSISHPGALENNW